MNINEIKAALERTKGLRREIMDLKPYNKLGYSLKDYIDASHERIRSSFYGNEESPFYPIFIKYTGKLEGLMDVNDSHLESAFKTYKTKLLSILDRYIRDLQRALQQYDSESGSTPLD